MQFVVMAIVTMAIQDLKNKHATKQNIILLKHFLTYILKNSKPRFPEKSPCNYMVSNSYNLAHPLCI